MSWFSNIFGPDPQIPATTDDERELTNTYYQMRDMFFRAFPQGWVEPSMDGRIVTVALRLNDNNDITPLTQAYSGHPNTVRAQKEAFILACQNIGLGLDVAASSPSDLTNR